MPAPRKPTALKLIAGTAQPCRINSAEPKLPRAVPPAPKSLTPPARKIWKEVCGIVDQMGILTLADGYALESLTEVIVELRAARSVIAAQGTTYTCTTKNGDVMVRARPEVAMAQDADRRLRGWLAMFGLSPADRSRVDAIGGTTGNPFSDL